MLQHRMSSRLLPLLVLRLSPHAETSPRGPQIETFGNGFKSLGFLSFFHFESVEAKCKYFANEMMKIHFFQINKSAGDDEPVSLGL